MAISLTTNAAKQIQQQIKKRGKGLALRVGVKKTGCSGLSYTYDYADEIRPDDHLFESHNVKVVVDIDTLPFLNGSEIDYIKEGLNSTFRFNNPNIDNTCGCGESFNIKTMAKA